ncbi:spore germination protein [Tissierella praeacuta DSM 18095]|uniref:Spore germination protein n=1 Tax=Tissierella praeacuta DSM 18095 TaxID=1123404 RepID=A0A1M4XTJ5_9FIRM|nr:endospore germination permease [Tissierella praeacuta]TCU79199.1 spore germination protein [Tissierella praeacuta]SHE96583.1 spore germination protein [Tissierella praeacuta DSM 18095]SUO99178.1 Spore germination protein YndE [Tissierella praeacuta]
MQKNNKISNKQIRALVVSAVVGTGILSLPNRISLILGNDGWIAIILSGILVIGITIIMNKLFYLYPDKDFFEIGRMVLGKWLFNIFLVFFLIYLIVSMAAISRNIAEILKAFLLENTPTEIIIISFILVTTYLSRSEIQVIGRAAYHIYPVVLGFVIILILISLTSVDFTNMLPLFQSNIRNTPKSISLSFFSYTGFEILLFSIPFTERKKETMKSSLMGVGIVIVIYLIIFVLSLSQYGLQSLRRQSFPILSLIKEIDLPGYFIENLDGLMVAIWVIVIFGTMVPFYYSAGKILSNLFNTKEHGLFILPLTPLIYIISLIPENIVQLSKQIRKFINYFGFVSIVFLPIIIYVIGLFKSRGSDR